MTFKIIIPARGNSKRLPGKNMKLLGGKPLIQHSIDFALDNLSADSIWVNSDNQLIIEFAKRKGVKTLLRPDVLATDYTTTVDVLQFQINYFKEHNIECDAIILLQPTSPFRHENLLKIAKDKLIDSKRNSLATFSISNKKIGIIKNNIFKPINYSPGQRSQDLGKNYFENGLLYITKCQTILLGKIITEDTYPLICDGIESTIDIDHPEDFIFADSLLKLKSDNHE